MRIQWLIPALTSVFSRTFSTVVFCTMVFVFGAPPAVQAQTLTQETSESLVWIQIEAQPTLAQAQDSARNYASGLDNVAGFYLGSDWYGIVLGPYLRDDANDLRRQLRREGRIPRDSFVASGETYRQQFWPIGANATTGAQPVPAPIATAPIAPSTAVDANPQDSTTQIQPAEQADVAPSPVIPDETLSEARASEGDLTGAERELLQIALQWAGYYDAAIDGAFGRGTRTSMRNWQAENNHETTGVLTTAQRAELIADYNAVLTGMDLQMVRDDATGIEIMIPTGVVEFSKYDPPFARFDAKGDLQAQVLLISQVGDQNRLFGLYEILQTLSIVPVDGPRTRGNASFELEGINDQIHSYTTATLKDGQIKGFSLIWPAGDDERRTRVLQNMQASFNTIDGVLDPALAIPAEDQAVDLVAGLAVRKPKLSQSGFYVNNDGAVLTTTQAVAGCERVTIDDVHEATVDYLDETLGLALLKPKDRLAPLGIAAFQTAVPRLQSQVAVAGYPYGGVLASPSLTFGRLADMRGLNGEEDIKRLNLTAQEGDAGGPVFDNGGAVLGMMQPRNAQNAQVLPADVSFAVDASEIITSLRAAGVAIETTDTVAFMPPETLTLKAGDITVLVSCW